MGLRGKIFLIKSFKNKSCSSSINVRVITWIVTWHNVHVSQKQGKGKGHVGLPSRAWLVVPPSPDTQFLSQSFDAMRFCFSLATCGITFIPLGHHPSTHELIKASIIQYDGFAFCPCVCVYVYIFTAVLRVTRTWPRLYPLIEESSSFGFLE